MVTKTAGIKEYREELQKAITILKDIFAIKLTLKDKKFSAAEENVEDIYKKLMSNMNEEKHFLELLVTFDVGLGIQMMKETEALVNFDPAAFGTSDSIQQIFSDSGDFEEIMTNMKIIFDAINDLLQKILDNKEVYLAVALTFIEIFTDETFSAIVKETAIAKYMNELIELLDKELPLPQIETFNTEINADSKGYEKIVNKEFIKKLGLTLHTYIGNISKNDDKVISAIIDFMRLVVDSADHSNDFATKEIVKSPLVKLINQFMLAVQLVDVNPEQYKDLFSSENLKMDYDSEVVSKGKVTEGMSFCLKTLYVLATNATEIGLRTLKVLKSLQLKDDAFFLKMLAIGKQLYNPENPWEEDDEKALRLLSQEYKTSAQNAEYNPEAFLRELITLKKKYTK